MNSSLNFSLRKKVWIVILWMVALVPFASHGGGVVSTPTFAAFNSALAGGGMVTFACDGTITVTTPISITANTIVDAAGHDIVISGGNTSQIFMVSAGISLTLNALIINNGFTTTNGGAIYNRGDLFATNCAFVGNYAIGTNGAGAVTAGSNGQPGGSARGGAIYNAGTLSLCVCLFQLNDAVGGSGGYAQTGATVGSGVGGNGGVGGAGGGAFGGAIFSTNSVNLFDCGFSGNGVQGGTGGAGGTAGYGPSGYGTPGVGGIGGDGAGAGLFTYKTSAVIRSTFTSQLTIGGSSGGSGNGYLTAPNGAIGGNAYGGGIYNAGTNITINCTFYANTNASGAGGNSGAAYTGPNGGNGGIAEGGGIYNILRAGVTNCTISTNVLYGGAGGTAYYYTGGTAGTVGSTGVATGGAIGNNGGTFTLKNSILAYSSYSGGSGSSGNGAGTITDAGNNLSSDASITLSGSGSHASTNPLLLPLADNGGYSLTCALADNSPAINAGSDAAASVTDQRGYFRMGTADIGSYEYGGTTMFVEALGSTASLDGNVGLFLIGGPNQPVTSPLTVNFTIGGTASNGVDYVTITNSAVIPTGFQYTRVLVNGIPGAFGGTNKTVTLTLVSGTNYYVTPNDYFRNADTVTIFDHNTYDSTKRYTRGTSTAPDFQSFVVPIGRETGVVLNDSGGNAAALFPGNRWTNMLYHFNATNLVSQTNSAGRLSFQNPIVAFGDRVGGSSLFVNQSYDFGIGVGTPSILTNSLRVQVYYRTNSALAGTITLTLPDVTNTNQLLNLVTNGFTQTFTGFGLQTTMVLPSSPTWGLRYGQNYILTHTASAAATNYYFVIEEKGYAPYNYLVLNQTNSVDWSRLYVLEFSPFPAGLATFINQPHFDGLPMPSIYQGKSLQELQSVQATLPSLSLPVPTNFLTLDASPELRRHPILDQFVKNMGNDPLALANYVINEVGLVDGIDYNTNVTYQTTVNLGGVNRSALCTFQEGQGSPMEQCALLVYLLRQAGIPATYVFPSNGGLQMLSSQMSKLLRVQLTGAVNNLGQTNVSTLLNVNYPWVAAYIGTNWVQIFPWLKDTEITEGFNLYDYLPTNYNSGYKWLSRFIANDTNIFSLSSSDQPLVLLPLFIQKNLNQNYPGMSVSDLGMQIVNRRHLYSQWGDFPLPFAVSGTPTVVESLKTNLSLFNTLEVKVYSQANPTKLIDTTEMYEADLQNRMLLLKFQQVGTANVHNMVLSLEPYSTAYTNVAAFSPNANPCWKLSTTNQLNSTDDNIVFLITRKRSKFLPSTYVSGELNYVYNEVGQAGLISSQTDIFRKGDLVTFCFDSGRVSQNMLDVHAQQIWQFNQNANTNQPATLDPDIYLGETTYLMGMNYFNYRDQFIDFASKLHKVTLQSWHEEGFALLRPRRDTTGALVNGGNVILTTPAVHMPNNGLGMVYNGSTMANSGLDYYSGTLDWWLQVGVQASAAEHGILKSFYVTNSLSTIKLLQQVGTNVVTLTAGNYAAMGQKSYNGVQLMNADPTVWATITSFFTAGADINSVVLMTPGSVTNGNYIGVGALLVSDTTFGALVGGLNGGYSNPFSDYTFAAGNSPNLTVDYSPDGSVSSFYLTTAADNNNPNYFVNGAVTSWDLVETASAIASGQVRLDPTLALAYASLAAQFGIGADGYSAYTQLYNSGTVSTQPSTYNDGSQRVADPVNMMTGEFYVDAPDITLPGPMPLQIRRNYGSQNLAENEFGFGWRMSYMPFLSVGTNSILIYATEMDGTTVAYRQTATNANIWLPQPPDNPTLNNNSSMGIGSVGNLFNNRLQLAVVSGTNTYTLTGADGSRRTFSQQSFPLGTFTRQRPYLNKWQDSRGNFYTFQFGSDPTQPDYGEVNRIQSSNGNFLGLYYDVYGHIIKAYTGDGRWLQYVYDQYGDLTTVTLPDQMEIDYIYQHANSVTNGVTNVYSTHLIVEEDKPDGRVLQNSYDSQRRVTNQLATAGIGLTPVRTATFSYTNNYSLSSPTNLLSGVTVISDYYNHLTIYYYTNSLVRKIVDPLNQTIVQEWYETNTVGGFQRSLKTVTDKRGLKTDFLYDALGNLTNTVFTGDLTGDGLTTQTATNAVTYNSNNLPQQITDPVGNCQLIVYDSIYPFLPQQVIHYAGATPVSTNLMVYGNAASVVVNGNTTQTNLAFGLLTRKVRAYNSPDAATNDLFYNGQGSATNSVQYTGTSDPNVVNLLFYNAREELVERTDAVGTSFVFSYDAMGRPTALETYEAGQTTPVNFNYLYYNANGELNWVDGPRYNPEDYIFYDYDGDGRRTTEIHWRSEAKSDGSGVQAPAGYNVYAQSFSQFDPLGNLLAITDPRGAVTTNTWDALSRLTQRKHLDTNGTTILSVEYFGYEPGGREKYYTNALGGVTTTLYTTNGLPKYRSNPDGSTNAWRYYLDGRIKREIQSNGAYWQTIYDDVNLVTTRVFYSATGTALATNSTQLDRRGNVIRRVDAANNAFTTTFDGLDRVKIAAGPALTNIVGTASGAIPGGPITYTTNVVQQISNNFFDAAGRSLTNVNALGEKNITQADALGRTTSVQIFSSSGALVREKSFAYSLDHNRVTVTDGSGANAISQTTGTDNDGHTVLSVAYPSASVTEFTLIRYDLAGNLVSVEHNSAANGSVSNWTTTTFAYDGLNRPIKKTDRDNAVTTYAYDSINDLTSRTLPGANLVWSAIYTNSGQVLQDWNTSGGAGTRTNKYTYFASGSPFAGLLQSVTDGRGVTSTYSYDDWLSDTNIITTGALPEQQMSVTWQYDPRRLLVRILQAFASTNTGPAMTVARTFDAYGQLTAENGLAQSWDAVGRRTQVADIGFVYQADGQMHAVNGASFSYATSGLLTGRTNGSRFVSIDQRDGEGRPLQATTKVNFGSVLTENWTWTGDGLPANYTATRDFTDVRNFSYAPLSRRLATETFNLNATTPVTNSYTFDNGASSNLGVLTKVASSFAAQTWNGTLDTFARVAFETNSVIHRSASGHVNGAATLRGYLNGQPLDVRSDSHSASTWSANMALNPGTNTLTVYADHPSGMFTTNRASAFTVSGGSLDQETSLYDGAGNVTNRVWKNASGQIVKSQALVWDALGRLVKLNERDANANGYNLVVTFDGLGRQMQTTETAVTNGFLLVSNPAPLVVNFAYDPEVQFLVLGVNVSQGQVSRQDWLAYGPDISGSYGGMHGVGGLETITTTSAIGTTTATTLNDYFGNVLGAVTNGTVVWNSSRQNLYAPVEGYTPPRLSLGAPTYASLAWRTRPANAAQLVQMGARPYDFARRAFLSADPLGHDSDPALNTAFGQNPAAYFDASGLCAKPDQSSSERGDPGFSFMGVNFSFGDSGTHIEGGGWGTTFTPYGEGLDPFQQTLDELSDMSQSFVDSALNTEARHNAANEFWHPDFSSGLGVTTWMVSGVSWTANTVDMAANFIPGKAALEDVVKLGVKDVTRLFTGDVAKNEIKVATGSAGKIVDVANPGNFTAGELGEGIASSPLASRAYRSLQENGFDVSIVNRADGFAGETLVDGTVNLNRYYNGSVNNALSTMVHESKHVDLLSNTGNLYGLRGAASGEYAARAREFFFNFGRRPNASERSAMKDEIRRQGY